MRIVFIAIFISACASMHQVNKLQDDINDIHHDVKQLDRKVDSLENLKMYPWTLK